MRANMLLTLLFVPLLATAQPVQKSPKDSADAPKKPEAALPDAPVAAPAEHVHDGAEYDTGIGGDAPIFKDVKLEFVSPKENSVGADSPNLDVVFRLSGYKTPGAPPAPGEKAPHVHVILDNQPYQADYDATRPFVLKGLTPGAHTVRAFPSRPWHESIKAPGAFAMVRFFVGKKEATKGKWPDLRKPLLTYSRPKGEYAGKDAERIMVDFWLTKAKLGPKAYKVRMTVDGKEWPLITVWKPLWLEGLAPGEHKVALDLLDKKGNAVENVFNHTERTFTVKP